MKPRFDRELTDEELNALSDDDLDLEDIPELDETFWKTAVLVHPDRTQSVTLRVKKSVLEAFKSQGKGYQTLMNAVLEGYARTMLKR